MRQRGGRPATGWIAAAAALALCGCDEDERSPRVQLGGSDPEQAQSAPAEGEGTPPAASPFAEVTRAVAVLLPTEGQTLEGVIELESDDGEVQVSGAIDNLAPNSRHGFHVHEHGDCSAADATSAGDHYNPDDTEHALPPQRPRHAGDMGNVEADDEGKVELDERFDVFSIAGPERPVLGRAIIVHADEDDGSQPSGDAGDRLACGVIGVAEQ